MTTCSRFESMNKCDRRMLLSVRIVEESVFGDIYRFERIVKREELMRRGVVENDYLLEKSMIPWCVEMQVMVVEWNEEVEGHSRDRSIGEMSVINWLWRCGDEKNDEMVVIRETGVVMRVEWIRIPQIWIVEWRIGWNEMQNGRFWNTTNTNHH